MPVRAARQQVVETCADAPVDQLPNGFLQERSTSTYSQLTSSEGADQRSVATGSWGQDGSQDVGDRQLFS